MISLENNQIQEPLPPQDEHTNVEPAAQHLDNVDETIELRRSSREKRPAISGDYCVPIRV
jgi:hypothetical protein